MFHHSLERIEAVTTFDPTIDDRTVIVASEAVKQEGRRDTNLVPLFSIHSADAMGRLSTRTCHPLREAEVQRDVAKRFLDLSVEELVVVLNRSSRSAGEIAVKLGLSMFFDLLSTSA